MNSHKNGPFFLFHCVAPLSVAVIQEWDPAAKLPPSLPLTFFTWLHINIRFPSELNNQKKKHSEQKPCLSRA